MTDSAGYITGTVTGDACRRWQESLTLYNEPGAHGAGPIRVRLVAHDHTSAVPADARMFL